MVNSLLAQIVLNGMVFNFQISSFHIETWVKIFQHYTMLEKIEIGTQYILRIFHILAPSTCRISLAFCLPNTANFSSGNSTLIHLTLLGYGGVFLIPTSSIWEVSIGQGLVTSAWQTSPHLEDFMFGGCQSSHFWAMPTSGF